MFKSTLGFSRKTMLLLLAGSLTLQTSYGDTPQASSSFATRKVRTAAISHKRIVRAQSEGSAELNVQAKTEEEFFDSKLIPASAAADSGSGWSGYCADLPSTTGPQESNRPPDPSQPPNPNTPSQPEPANSPAPLPNLQAGQSQLTSQNMVPAFFGDFFAPNGTTMTVPGALLGSTPGTALPAGQLPFAVGFAQPNISNTGHTFSYLRQLEASSAPGILFKTDPSNHVWFLQNPGTGTGVLPLSALPHSSNTPYVSSPFTYGTTSTSTPPFGLPTPVPHNPSTVFAAYTSTGHNPVYGISPSNIIDTHSDFHSTSGTTYYGFTNAQDPYLYLFALTTPSTVNIYSPSATGGGIQKLVENSSPIPRDRVFLNYNYFANTPILVNGQSLNVNRLTPGFEKTFLDQRMSVEVRVPFATTISNLNLSDGSTNNSDLILGNQTTYLKALLYSNPTFSLASGIGVQAPTAGNTTYGINGYSYSSTGPSAGQVTTGSQQTVLQINNQGWHVMPYLGSVYTPNDRLWAQSVGQLDFATNGNSVYGASQYPVTTVGGTRNDPTINIVSATTPMTSLGSLRDTNFMYLTLNGGYWLYKVRNPYARGVTGFAPTIEVDYNQSLQRTSTVQGVYGNVTPPIQNQTIVNGIVGATTIIGHDKYLSVAYVAPLTTGTNRVFDGELRVMFNYYFGAPRINPRFSNVPGS